MFPFTVAECNDFYFSSCQVSVGLFLHTHWNNKPELLQPVLGNAVQLHARPPELAIISIMQLGQHWTVHHQHLLKCSVVWHFHKSSSKQWQHEWKECENRWFMDFCFLVLFSLRSGIYLISSLLRAANQTWFTSGKICLLCHSVITLKRSKVCEMYPTMWSCVTISLEMV